MGIRDDLATATVSVGPPTQTPDLDIPDQDITELSLSLPRTPQDAYLPWGSGSTWRPPLCPVGPHPTPPDPNPPTYH